MILAAPSWVVPGTVADNVRFLAGRVDGIALCLFELDACLAYGDADLPPDLASVSGRDGSPMRWHVHMPADLPWPGPGDADGCRRAADAALAVLGKAAFLNPEAAVLHPPAGTPAEARRLLRPFAERWHARSAVPLLLENIGESDVLSLEGGFLADAGLGFCLDVGHALGYRQDALLESDLPERAAVIHWSAPCGGDRHGELAEWTPEERDRAAGIAARLAPAAAHVLEMFRWKQVEASLPVLEGLPIPSAPQQ